jgi:hypothetical protein
MMGLPFWGLLSFDSTIAVKSFVMNKQRLCLEEGIQSLLRPTVATLDISMGSWHGWVDQNLAKKTWPKVHFASFIMCTMLTHDDDKMISIHFLQFFSICNLCIVEAKDLYKSIFLTQNNFSYKCYGLLKMGCVFSIIKSP